MKKTAKDAIQKMLTILQDIGEFKRDMLLPDEETLRAKMQIAETSSTSSGVFLGYLSLIDEYIVNPISNLLAYPSTSRGDFNNPRDRRMVDDMIKKRRSGLQKLEVLYDELEAIVQADMKEVISSNG